MEPSLNGIKPSLIDLSNGFEQNSQKKGSGLSDEWLRTTSREAFEALCLSKAREALEDEATCSKLSGSIQSLSWALSVFSKVALGNAGSSPKPRRRKVKRSGARVGKWVSGTGFGSSDDTNQEILQSIGSAKNREGQLDRELTESVTELSENLTKTLLTTNIGDDDRLCCLGGIMVTPFQQGLIGCSHENVDRILGQKRRHKTVTHDAASARDYSLVDLLRFFWRNDSLMDISERIQLYVALLGLVKVLSESPIRSGLPGVLFWEDSDSESMMSDVHTLSESFATEAADVQLAEKKKRPLIVNQSVNCVFALLCKVKNSGNYFIQTVETMSGDNKGLRPSRAFLRDLENVVINIEKRLGKNNFYGKHFFEIEPLKKADRRDLLSSLVSGAYARSDCVEENRHSKSELEVGYCQALSGLQLRSVMILELTSADHGGVSHAFSEAAKAVTVSATRQRMLRIGRELSLFSDSLPLSWASGIFVCVDEMRPDVLSCLILGPKDTPYENGAFIFDVFLPYDYPASPPKVLLKTTGHGTVRFNPNLYQCGKVCLSLLGTWPGRGWDESKSTLMQVLVSIQSLIMVSEPYFNEPGYEEVMGTGHGQLRSREYNHQIRVQTMRFAILENIKKPPYLFRDVLQTHFALKQQEIRSQCTRWVQEAAAESSQKSQILPPNFFSNGLPDPPFQGTLFNKEEVCRKGKVLCKQISSELNKMVHRCALVDNSGVRKVSSSKKPDSSRLRNGDSQVLDLSVSTEIVSACPAVHHMRDTKLSSHGFSSSNEILPVVDLT